MTFPTRDDVTLAVLAVPLEGRTSKREAMLRVVLAVAADPEGADNHYVPGIDAPPGPEATRAVLAMPLPGKVSRREAQLRAMLAISTFPADPNGLRTGDDTKFALVAGLFPRAFDRACDDLIAAGHLGREYRELPDGQ